MRDRSRCAIAAAAILMQAGTAAAQFVPPVPQQPTLPQQPALPDLTVRPLTGPSLSNLPPSAPAATPQRAAPLPRAATPTPQSARP
jgi:hypothetical protein